ncbi:hypothetical protein FE204_17760 [Bacillus subtilis]|nr:hypothetical protein [Bacillus subtilis]
MRFYAYNRSERFKQKSENARIVGMIDFVLEQTKKASLNNPKSEMLSLCPHHLSTTAALSRVTAAGSLSITFITLASTSIPIDK